MAGIGSEGRSLDWIDALGLSTRWRALEEGGCALGCWDVQLPHLSLSDPAKSPGTVWRMSILIVAPLWNFAMAGMADPAFEGLGREFLGERLGVQRRLDLAALDARGEGGREDDGSPPREIARFLEMSAIARNAADHQAAAPGELVSLDAFHPARAKAMMMGRSVARELRESEFGAAVDGLGAAVQAALGPAARPWRGGGSLPAHPHGWMPPPWLRVGWPDSPEGFGPPLSAMRQRIEIEAGTKAATMEAVGKAPRI